VSCKVAFIAEFGMEACCPWGHGFKFANVIGEVLNSPPQALANSTSRCSISAGSKALPEPCRLAPFPRAFIDQPRLLQTALVRILEAHVGATLIRVEKEKTPVPLSCIKNETIGRGFWLG
jgi:hypothetical protein